MPVVVLDNTYVPPLPLLSSLFHHPFKVRCPLDWGHHRVDVSICHAVNSSIVLIIPSIVYMDVCANTVSFLPCIKLVNTSHLHPDLVLFCHLSFGPVVPQASRQFTRISLGPDPTLRYRSLPLLFQTHATKP